MDIRVDNHGSVCVVHGITATGKCWLDEHLDQAALRFGQGYVVEPRYVGDVVGGMIEDGLEVVGA